MKLLQETHLFLSKSKYGESFFLIVNTYNEEVEQRNTPCYQVLHPLLNNRAFFSAMRHSKDITLLHNLIAKGIVNHNTPENIELVTTLQYVFTQKNFEGQAKVFSTKHFFSQNVWIIYFLT